MGDTGCEVSGNYFYCLCNLVMSLKVPENKNLLSKEKLLTYSHYLLSHEETCKRFEKHF